MPHIYRITCHAPFCLAVTTTGLQLPVHVRSRLRGCCTVTFGCGYTFTALYAFYAFTAHTVTRTHLHACGCWLYHRRYRGCIRLLQFYALYGYTHTRLRTRSGYGLPFTRSRTFTFVPVLRLFTRTTPHRSVGLRLRLVWVGHRTRLRFTARYAVCRLHAFALVLLYRILPSSWLPCLARFCGSGWMRYLGSLPRLCLLFTPTTAFTPLLVGSRTRTFTVAVLCVLYRSHCVLCTRLGSIPQFVRSVATVLQFVLYRSRLRSRLGYCRLLPPHLAVTAHCPHLTPGSYLPQFTVTARHCCRAYGCGYHAPTRILRLPPHTYTPHTVWFTLPYLPRLDYAYRLPLVYAAAHYVYLFCRLPLHHTATHAHVCTAVRILVLRSRFTHTTHGYLVATCL